MNKEELSIKIIIFLVSAWIIIFTVLLISLAF